MTLLSRSLSCPHDGDICPASPLSEELRGKLERRLAAKVKAVTTRAVQRVGVRYLYHFQWLRAELKFEMLPK